MASHCVLAKDAIYITYIVMTEYDFSIRNVGFQNFQCNCESEVNFQLFMSLTGWKKKEPVYVTVRLSIQSIYRSTICKLPEAEE